MPDGAPTVADGTPVRETGTAGRGDMGPARFVDPEGDVATGCDYDAIAPVYDAIFAGLTEDLAFWPALVPPGAAVCELGCGTGRVTARLTGTGVLIGVDPSEAMLEIARRRLPDVDFRSGSICDVPLDDGSVDLVLCTRGCLAHLVTPANLVRGIREIRRVLRAGGRLVIDVPFYGPRDPLLNGHTSLRHQRSVVDSGTEYALFFEARWHSVRRYLDITQYVRVSRVEQHPDGPDDGARVLRAGLATRVFALPELVAVLIACGLEPVEVYGDYDRGPLEDSSERMIVVAEVVVPGCSG